MLMKDKDNLMVSHVYLEQNHVIDLLAKMAM